MGVQEHGQILTLLRQAKPNFTRTKGGGFDTGRRRFKCKAVDLINVLTRYCPVGMSDEKLLNAAVGGDLVGYRNMLVSNVQVEHEELGVVVIGVEFEGVMAAKAGSAVFNTAAQEQTGRGSLEGFTILQSSNLDVPIPTVVHTWTSLKGRPSAVAVGQALMPPGITETETEQAEQYHASFVDGMVTLFEGWILGARQARSPGDQVKSKVWEVVDTYQFKVTRAQGLAV